MNILWISHFVPYPPKGGHLQRSYYLLKALSQDHQIYLVAFNQKAILSTPTDLLLAKQHLSNFCHRVEILNLPSDTSKVAWLWLVVKSFFTPHPYTVNWTKSKKMSDKIHQILQETKIDAAHFDTIGLAEYLDDVAKIPSVLNHHNIESAMMYRRTQNERNIFKKIYFYNEARKIRRYESQKCPQFKVNITVSDKEGIILRNFVDNVKIEVIENCVDTKFYAPMISINNEKSLIFVGTMNWYPNKDAMLFFIKDIWPLLQREVAGLKMYIVGKSPPKRIVLLSHNDSDLIVTGYVEDVRPFLAKATAYICPLRTGGGTKVKILDAMAAGKPIIATSIACEGIPVQHEQHVLFANEPEEFVHQIKRLLEDGQLRNTLIDNSFNLVRTKFSSEIVGNKINNLYSKLIKSEYT